MRMTELQTHRESYGPIRLGMTRLVASLFTLLGGFWLTFWLVSLGDVPSKLTDINVAMLTVGAAIFALIGIAMSFVLAWAWLGFKKPGPFIRHVRYINWEGHYRAHCWLQDGKLKWKIIGRQDSFAPPQGVAYSLMIPLAWWWGTPVIYDWSTRSPQGSVVTDLKIRVVLASIESWQYKTDMVWLRDKTGNRILASLEEALGFWIPGARQGMAGTASLERAVRRLQSLLPTLERELADKNRMVGEAMAQASITHRHTSALEQLFKDARAVIGGAVHSYDQSRRLRFQKEAQPVFEALRREYDRPHARDRRLSDTVIAELS